MDLATEKYKELKPMATARFGLLDFRTSEKQYPNNPTSIRNGVHENIVKKLQKEGFRYFKMTPIVNAKLDANVGMEFENHQYFY